MDDFICTSLLQIFHIMGLTCFDIHTASPNSESLQLPVPWHELLFCCMCHTNSLSHVPVLQLIVVRYWLCVAGTLLQWAFQFSLYCIMLVTETVSEFKEWQIYIYSVKNIAAKSQHNFFSQLLKHMLLWSRRKFCIWHTELKLKRKEIT